MNFERDLFISYASLDNLSVKEGEHGWVENFHTALEMCLSQLMGEKPQIWRYPKLKGSDVVSTQPDDLLLKTALMIPVLSPKYIASEWCHKELQRFVESTNGGAGEKINGKSRIFKLIKTAVPYDEHPREIADNLGYEFYIIDSASGDVKELSQKSRGELDQIYWARLDDIAHDICDTLERIKQLEVKDITPREKKFKVYLAETSPELKEQRDIIKRELHEYGCEILPGVRLSSNAMQFKESVEQLLDQCVLSIHLVGGGYGPVPKGSHKSIVELQNELAVKKCKTGGLQRLIWLMPGSEEDARDERQKLFVNLVRTDIETQYGADMFETPLEDLKYAIEDKLESIESGKVSVPVKDKVKPVSPSCVYLAETNYDLNAGRESIKQRLVKQGYQVLPEQPLPLIYPDLIKTIDKTLEQCDISIHLIGEDYGVVPGKTDKSIIFIQEERAAGRSQRGQLQRLVRLSPTFDQSDERQRLFIDSLKARAEAKTSPNDSIFTAASEDVETTIFEKLQAIEEKKRKDAEAEKAAAADGETGRTGPLQIYLICDRRDLDSISELEDFLYNSEFDVFLPAFEGNEEDLIRDHQENLKICDAAIVYYGTGNDLWLNSITRHFRKIAGYGRTREMLAKAVYLAPPVTRSKERIRFHDWHIINGLQGFSAGSVVSFMEILKTKAKS